MTISRFCACLVWMGLICATAQAAPKPPVLSVSRNDMTLRAEILDDDLIHFALTRGAVADAETIRTSPMIAKVDYAGPTKWTALQGPARYLGETADLAVRIDPATLAVEIVQQRGTATQTVVKLAGFLRPPTLTQPARSSVVGGLAELTIGADDFVTAYGLGEQFFEQNETAASWTGLRRTPGNEFGNRLVQFHGGAVGNAQFPVLYALGNGGRNVAVFVDEVRPQMWDLSAKPWRMQMRSDALHWYVLTGPDLLDLRKDFMELTGRPPVPPKKAMGLWVSEYGFDDWAELEDKLKTLRAGGFPIDGFVLDLQWFGNIGQGGSASHMGTLDWDRAKFPDPAGKMAALARDEGVGLIPIEESYVCQHLPEFNDLGKQGMMVRKSEGGDPVVLKSWWGTGGMVDWTNPKAGDHWHDRKRQPLLDAGILGHWTDLGEPENFEPTAWFAGSEEGHDAASNHNLYNFRWVESIARGYERNKMKRRPLVLSRSGTAGMQRFGAAMWSGDIGSNMPSLAAHQRVQLHMSFSGIDYFGSDIGGFHRWSLDGDLNDLYTRWFAGSCLTDMPLRPHTSNTENKFQTAPDRIGDAKSNLANLRLRYELIPYLYSLAHRAHRFGEPVVPPLVLYHQDDPTARQICDEKLVGQDLLAAVLTQYGQEARDVYLPAGRWVDWHTGESTVSKGEWLKDVPVRRDGLIRAPLFARAGAIVPLMPVDDKTMNALGKRKGGERDDTLAVRVFADERETRFTLYEDDGETIDYLTGGARAVRETPLTQQSTKSGCTVTLGPATGTYAGAPNARPILIHLVPPPGKTVASVEVDGGQIQDWKAGPYGVRIAGPAKPVDVARTIRVTWKSDAP